MDRDTGMSMPMGITCFAVAVACSAAVIGRPSAGIGRVISGEIGRSWFEGPEIVGGVAVIGFVAYVAYSHVGASNYRHNAEQQIAKCELKGMDTHTMGMKLTLAYCMQAAGYKFEPLDPDCEKLMDTANPSCWLGAIEDPCVGRQATIEPQASKCKAAGR